MTWGGWLGGIKYDGRSPDMIMNKTQRSGRGFGVMTVK